MPDLPTTTGRMARGTVKWFNVEKGFGFIGVETGEHAGRDFFVHHTAIEDRSRVLQDGQPVEFDIVTGPKGPQAANVVAVGDAPPAAAPKPEALGDALKHLKAAQSIIEREAKKLTTSAEGEPA